MSSPECEPKLMKCPKCGKEMYYSDAFLSYACDNINCEKSVYHPKKNSPVIKYEKGCPPVVKDLRFQPGNVVRLKSGGPVMTVTSYAGGPTKGEYMICCWFDKNDILHNNTFNVLSLEIAPARERLLKYTSEKSGIEQPYQRPENSNGQAATCKSKLLGDPEIDVFSLCTLPENNC